MNSFTNELLANCTDLTELQINLKELDFRFSSKPLLVGGNAMEYYKMRQSKNDIDFVITEDDYERLSLKYPNNIKEADGNFGICLNKIELWKTICLFEYDFLAENSIEKDEFLIVSFEMLMFLKVLGMENPKNLRDLELMQDRIIKINNMRHGYF